MISSLLLLCAQALAFPNFDANNEVVLLGHIGDVASSSQATPLTQGGWRTEGAVSLSDPIDWADNLLFPAGDAAHITDGIVRMRVVPGARLDLTLLARADVEGPDDLDRMTGYGVSLTKGALQLFRWDGGLAQPLAPKQDVDLASHPALEVVWQLSGPFLTATVYDGETFALLGATSAHDPTIATGRVGLRAYHKQDASTKVTGLTVMGGSRAATSAESGARPAYGNVRHALITWEDFQKLPADLQAAAEKPFIDIPGKPRVVLLSVDRPQAERLHRIRGIDFSETPTIPWGLLDMDYQRARLQGRPTPTERGFVVDASYKDPQMVEDLLKAYAERFPEICALHRIGTTHRNQPIWALKISDHVDQDEDEPAMFLNGSHHGSELLSVEYALDTIQVLVEGYGHDPGATRYVDGLETWVVPLVNPDGNKLFLTMDREGGRKNGRDTNGDGVWDGRDGVDLNRNYPYKWASLGTAGSSPWHRAWWYRGDKPATEPEVQAIMDLANREHFAGSMTYHTVGTVLIAPYSISGSHNPDPDVAWNVAEHVVASLPSQPNRKRFKVVQNIYDVDGVDQDWHYYAHGTLALLLEGSHHNPKSAATRKASVAATRPAFQALFDRFLDGPSVSGHVTDRAGDPLEAVVTVDEIALHEGETWTARGRDGRFDRFLPGAGSYTITASAPGYETVSKTIRVTGHQTVDLILPAIRAGNQ